MLTILEPQLLDEFQLFDFDVSTKVRMQFRVKRLIFQLYYYNIHVVDVLYFSMDKLKLYIFLKWYAFAQIAKKYK